MCSDAHSQSFSIVNETKVDVFLEFLCFLFHVNMIQWMLTISSLVPLPFLNPVWTLESPLDCKEVHPKGDQSWMFIGRTDAEAEIPILWPPDAKSWLIWKDPDAGKDWKAGGEGDDRGWDGLMASPTQWTWLWVNSGNWWWTGRPGVLQSMGLQRVVHDWATEVNWTECSLETASWPSMKGII